VPGIDCLYAQAWSAWVRGGVPSSEVLAVLVLLGGIGGGLVGIGMKCIPDELLGDIRTVRVARVDEGDTHLDGATQPRDAPIFTKGTQ